MSCLLSNLSVALLASSSPPLIFCDREGPVNPYLLVSVAAVLLIGIFIMMIGLVLLNLSSLASWRVSQAICLLPTVGQKTDIATARLLAQLWTCLALCYLITDITLSHPVSSVALAASFLDLRHQTYTTTGVLHRFQRCKHNVAGPNGPYADTASSDPTRTPICTLRYHQCHHGGAYENIGAIVVSFDPGHLLLAGPCHRGHSRTSHRIPLLRGGSEDLIDTEGVLVRNKDVLPRWLHRKGRFCWPVYHVFWYASIWAS